MVSTKLMAKRDSMKILAALLTPLYDLLIRKGISYLKELISEWKTQAKEKKNVKKCLNEKDAVKRAECMRDELND